mmetsp:Transcript_26193/g.72255  ORF Transcript_26193/g.72255 Transcript_26193/m.72255 type:complete len:858 (+) Transcript_26193:335-2908(+)
MMIDAFNNNDMNPNNNRDQVLLLEAVFRSLPAHLVIKDLDGHCIMENHGDCDCVEARNEQPPQHTNNKEQQEEDPVDEDEASTVSSSSASSWAAGGPQEPSGDDDDKDESQRNNNKKNGILVFPLKDSNGTIIGSCEMTTTELELSNKTEETRQQQQQQVPNQNRHDEEKDENESLYHDMIQQVQTAVAVHEIVTNDKNEPIDCIFRNVNPAFEQFLGVEAPNCVGKTLTEVFPGIENDSFDWVTVFGTAALTGETQKFTHYSDYLQNWYSGVAYQTDAEKGRFAVMFMEITDQIQSQEDLKESEERHRNLFESMIQGVVYQEASGAIITANPAAERILGLTMDQMCGRSSVDPRWKSVREDGTPFPGNEHPSMEALQTGQKVTGVIMGVYHPESDENRWITIDAVPRIRPGEEKPYQVYTTFTDVTERKEFEHRLLTAKKNAEVADNLKSAFLGQMSHEIRTPLNGIMGHIDLALANGLSEQDRAENLEGLKVAKSSGALLLNIIQDILDLSKIEAGQLVVNQDEPFSVRSTISQTSSTAEAIIKSKNKTIKFDSSVDASLDNTMLLGDPFRLQQVINNLVSNAIKFTSKGKVELRIKRLDQDRLEISVLDTGKGVPQSHIETIFEPFRQVDISDTRQHGGTGLGLTISRKLVAMMGGELRLESSVLGPIRGSLFAFTIPYRPHSSSVPSPTPLMLIPSSSSVSSESKQSSNSLTLSTQQQQGESGEKAKILVAEDDPISARMVRRMLERSGYDVALAKNGEEAVAAYTSQGALYSLVLMDVQMPVCDGHEATQRIRERETQLGESPIPIIALSAGAMKGEKEQGLSFGMTDYLTKPVDFKQLVQTIQKYVRNPAT